LSEERIVASIVPDEDASIRSLNIVGHPPIDISIVGDSPAIIIASRPHSHETDEYENAKNIENDNPHNKINTQEVKCFYTIKLPIEEHILIEI